MHGFVEKCQGMRAELPGVEFLQRESAQLRHGGFSAPTWPSLAASLSLLQMMFFCLFVVLDFRCLRIVFQTLAILQDVGCQTKYWRLLDFRFKY